MKRLGFTARIAIIFVIAVGFILGGTFAIFRTTVGLQYRRHFIGQVTATKAFLLALELEQRAAGRSPLDPEMRPVIEAAAAERGIEIAVLDLKGKIAFSTTKELHIWSEQQGRPAKCGDRRCRLTSAPPYPSFVPLERAGARVATLALTHQVMSSTVGLKVFLLGMSLLGLCGLIGVVLFSVYLARPLRRMSRSMDRIAGGDLEHRVGVKGRDEVALMGRSFNAMADRVGMMISSQKELMAGLSHELRSPLSRMKLSLELLRESGADDKRVDALDGEVDALDALVDELLAVSRVDLAAASLKPERADVRELAEESWQRIAEEARARDVQRELELPAGVCAKVDRALIVRALGNLFENALKYGDGAPVRLAARREGDRLELTVSDGGPGVPPEALPRLFEPFFRVDSSRSRRTGGTGVGLMIVRRAVEAHGGKVRAQLPEAGGLAITFDLPVE